MGTQNEATVNVREGDEGIPSVVDATRRKTNWQNIGVIVLAVAVVGGIGGFALTRVLGEKLKAPEREDKATQATAAGAKAAGAARQFPTEAPRLVSMGTVGSTPTTIFPAADVAAQVATDNKPIEVRPDGTVATKGGATSSRPASGEKQSASPDDGPVLVALAPSRPAAGGSAFAAGSPNGEPSAPGASSPGRSSASAPDLSATQRSLSAYQQRLTGLIEQLAATQQAGAASAAPPGVPPVAGLPGAQQLVSAAQSVQQAGLFGGQLQSSGAAPVSARVLANRSLTLPKGTAFTCALKTKVVSAVSGLVGCQVLRNVYSDDGRTVLIERGSHLDGEYRVTQVKPGVTRIPTIWTRVRTPNGVIADLESPATGPLGESGLPCHVDNRWPERIGAALLVGFLDDVLRIVVANATPDDANGDTIVLSSTGQQSQRLPEKVLDSTINIPPTITQNQGGLVGIYVARDVDFSSVYALRAAEASR